MARATSIGLLKNYPNLPSYSTAQQQLKSPHPLLRLGALSALEFLPLQQRWNDISPMLDDPVRSVRLEASRLLIGISGLGLEQQAILDPKIERYIEALMVNADMPNGQLNLAAAYLAQGAYNKAEQAYKHGLKLDSRSVSARLNLADLYRLQGKDQQALKQLLQVQLKSPDLESPELESPDNAVVHFSLGLAQIRTQLMSEGLVSLERASQLAPKISRYSYVYGIALNGQGRSKEAVQVMSRALMGDRNDRDLLFALATINRDLGRLEDARGFAQRLVLAFPEDTAAAQLKRSLQ